MRSVTVILQLMSLANAIRTGRRKYAHGTTQEGFLKADLARTSKIEITPKNLLVGTSSNPKSQVLKYGVTESLSLAVELVNNFNRADIRAYTSGLDEKPVRVLSPGTRHDLDSQLFGNYWDTYVK
ncbi:hypothetical protein ACHAPK_011151 [Fusarium culmorum]